MQDRPFHNLKATGIFLLFCAGLLYSMPKILGGGFEGAIQVALIFTPILLALYLAARPFWPAILISSMMFNDAIAGVVFFDRVRMGMVVSLIMVGFYILEKAMHHRVIALPNDRIKRAWTVLAVIITARILWDRPGSARTGGTGGMGEAIMYLAGAWAFFAAGWQGMIVGNLKRQRQIMVVIAAVVAVPILIRAFASGSFYNIRMFNREIWLLMACLLAGSLGSVRMRMSRIPWFYIFSAVSLLLAFLTTHRSRPAFVIVMVLAAAALYKKFKRTALFIGVAGFIGLGALLMTNRADLPVQLVRTMSIFVNVDRTLYSGFELGETGWESKFRSEINKIAFDNIRKSPFVGKGFNINLAELLGLLNTADTRTGGSGADVVGLALTGGYHNSLLALTVSCGIFAGLLYIYCLLASLIAFCKFTYFCQNSEFKIMGVILIVFFIPCCGQMLMNGHGYDFIVMGVMLGFMRGLQWQAQKCFATDQQPVIRNQEKQWAKPPVRNFKPRGSVRSISP